MPVCVCVCSYILKIILFFIANAKTSIDFMFHPPFGTFDPPTYSRKTFPLNLSRKHGLARGTTFHPILTDDKLLFL